MIEAFYTVTEKEFVEAASAYCKPQYKQLPGYWATQVATGVFAGLAVVTMRFNPI